MEVCAGFELIAIENATALGHDLLEISKRREAQMIRHMRHGSPPRLLALQSILSPNRRESLPAPSAGVRMIPLVGASRASDVLLVQLIPTDHAGVPVTKSEIDKRLGQITFNAPLQKELEVSGMMKKLLRKEGQPTSRLGRKINSLELHHLSAEDYVDGLGQASVLNTKWDFLSHL